MVCVREYKNSYVHIDDLGLLININKRDVCLVYWIRECKKSTIDYKDLRKLNEEG